MLFKSNETEESLCYKIENEIEAAFGIPVKAILRTSAELENIILNCPFSEEEVTEAETLSEVESLYVALLALNPSKEKVACIDAYRSERDGYLLFHHSIRNSKLANNLYKLNVPTTVRNWKTLSKLAALAKTMAIE